MITLNTLKKMKQTGEKIAMLTCYDAHFCKSMNQAGVDVLLIGDSLGMVVQGHTSTLPVRLEDICYHTEAVARVNERALILADLPFGAYQRNKEQAFDAAVQLMQAGAHMVKLEGGAMMAETVHYLQERAIPVCAHIGLTPQYVNIFGGYKVQGVGDEAAEAVLNDALAHNQAGASMILMECVPEDLGRTITQSVHCPTIGIGAGVDCDGQVLVMHDMLGVHHGRVARFVKNFLDGQNSIEEAFRSYVQAVKNQSFPSLEHTFTS